MAATSFWKDASTAVGLTLQIVDAETEEGTKLIASAGIAGVPCLVADLDRSYHGLQISDDKAKVFLQPA